MPNAIDHLLRAAGRLGLPGVHRAANALRPAPRLSTEEARFVTPFAGLAYEGLLTELIDREIFYFGGYALAELDFLDRAARKISSKVFYDIGANVGQHALWMSGRTGVVHAFEPSTRVRARLESNLVRNSARNIQLWPVGLGDRDEDARLGDGFANNSGSRSLLWGLESGGEAVNVARGDEFVTRHELALPDLVKIDVEGYESRVLSGLSATLKAARPIMLIELVHPGRGGFADQSDFVAHLYPDHRLYTLEGRRRAVLRPFDWNAEEAVCIPAERADAFLDMLR